MYENLYELVPKDKFDTSNIDRLLRLSDNEMKFIVGDLLKWIQDMNWPVAIRIVDVLAQRAGILESHILEILSPEQNDDIWKYWIISDLIPRLKDKLSQRIISAIKRIAVHPTTGECMEEVDVAAKRVLCKLNC